MNEFQTFPSVEEALQVLAQPHVKSMGGRVPFRSYPWDALCLGACAGRLPTGELFAAAVGAPAPVALTLEMATFRLYTIKGALVDHPMRRPAEDPRPIDGTSLSQAMPGTGVRWIDCASDWMDFSKFATSFRVPDADLLDAALRADFMHPDNRLAEYESGDSGDHVYRYVVARYDGQLALFMRKQFKPDVARFPSKWELHQGAGATMEAFMTDPRLRLTVVKPPSEETLKELSLQKVLNNLAQGE